MKRQYDRTIDVQVDTVRFSGLDIELNAVRTSRSEPNSCKLQVFNLNPQHRRQLAALPTVQVNIEAGYGGDTSTVFRGEMREVFSRQENQDWVTELNTHDSVKALKRARINKSFGKGTKIGNVLQELAKELNVDAATALPELLKASKLIDAQGVFLNGTVVSGNAADELTKLLKAAGKEWSIQNGALQLLDVGQFVEGIAIVLTKSSGLIGSPTIGNDHILRCTALLNPDIYPGRKIIVESREVDQVQCRVERAEYEASTRGGAWYVHLEAKVS